MNTRADAALALTPPDLDAAELATQASLSQAPANATTWARAAYIRWLKTGHLDREALIALDMSYRTAPLGPDVTTWRLRFMFENWAAVGPDLRLRALAEFSNFAHYHKGAASIADSIQSPSGRLAAALALRQINIEIGKKARHTRSGARI